MKKVVTRTRNPIHTFPAGSAACLSVCVEQQQHDNTTSHSSKKKQGCGGQSPQEDRGVKQGLKTSATMSVHGGVVTPLMRWENQGNVCSCYLSRQSGGSCAVGTGDGVLHLWRISDTKPRCVGTVHAFQSGKVTAVAMDGSETKIMLGASTGTMKLLDMNSERVMDTLTAAHRTSITTLSFNPTDPHHVASGSMDATVKYWDTRAGSHPIHVLRSSPSSITSLTTPPDARWIAVGDDDGRVTFVDMRKWKPIGELACAGAPATCLRLHPLELLLAAGTGGGAINMFDVAQPFRQERVLRHSHVAPVWSVEHVPAGANDYVVSSSSEGVKVHVGASAHSSYDLAWEGEVIDSTYAETTRLVLQAVVRRSEVTIWGVDMDALERRPPPPAATATAAAPANPSSAPANPSSAAAAAADRGRQRKQHPQPSPVGRSSSNPVAAAAVGGGGVRGVAIGQQQQPASSSSSAPSRRNLVRSKEYGGDAMIPAEPREPLELDLARWRGGGGGGSSGGIGGGDSGAVTELRKTLRTGEKMEKLLHARVEAVQVVRSLWGSGERQAAIRHAEKAGQSDLGVITDLLGCILSVQRHKEAVGVEHCEALLPAAGLVIARGTDQAASVALGAVRFLCHKFLDGLHRTALAPQPPGVDLAFQDRLSKAKQCLREFLALRAPLKSLLASTTSADVTSEGMQLLQQIEQAGGGVSC